MDYSEHFPIIKQGVQVWNSWRESHPEVKYPQLNHVDLSYLDLQNANFKNVRFYQSKLSQCNLEGANLENACLFDAKLMGANLSNSICASAMFNGCDLSCANLHGAIIHDGVFLKADLEGASLVGASAKGAIFLYAKLRKTKLSNAILEGSNFHGAFLEYADLQGANLSSCNLSLSTMVDVNLSHANLSYAKVYGVSAWNIDLTNAQQLDLIISKEEESLICVDDLEVAQLIYLMLNNRNITKIFQNVAGKGVLILGRFTEDRMVILQEIKKQLRIEGYLPILFDFDRPKGSNLTETIVTLAGMSLFVIADITKPKSSPSELQATIPVFKIPFVPILQIPEKPFAVFQDLAKDHDSENGGNVIKLLEYSSVETLRKIFKKAIINPAIELRKHLDNVKNQPLGTRNESDFL